MISTILLTAAVIVAKGVLALMLLGAAAFCWLALKSGYWLIALISGAFGAIVLIILRCLF